MSDQGPTPQPRFQGLQQTDFIQLERAAYLKGLLKPFKSKGALEAWANECFALRDELIALAQRQVLPQVRRHPFHLLPVELAQQRTGAGTTFLRWRRPDRSAMGVALWQDMVSSTATPFNLLGDLHAIEQQRVVLNMQISLLHTLGRQAQECASKLAQAEDAYLHRLTTVPAAMRDH